MVGVNVILLYLRRMMKAVLHIAQLNTHTITQKLGSERVSERANERVLWSAAERASEESSAEQGMSEWRERTSEMTSKWPNTYVPIFCCNELLIFTMEYGIAQGDVRVHPRSMLFTIFLFFLI